MATVTPNLTDISLCEADDWDGGLGTLDVDSFIQGAACLSISYPGAGLRAETTKTITAANFVALGYPVIYGWLTFARLAMLETYANGGLRFIVKSSSTAWSAWKVAGGGIYVNLGGGHSHIDYGGRRVHLAFGRGYNPVNYGRGVRKWPR